MSYTRPQISGKQWRRLRQLILERDHFICYMCGKKATEVDHIKPGAAGGTNDPNNLAAACGRCNNSKHARWVPDPVVTVDW